MKVAVIGSGNMGSGFAKALAAAGMEVIIGHRDPAKAASLAEQIGANAQGGGIAAAIKLADIAIMAVPFGAYAETIKAAGELRGKILVDITNPVTPDFKGLVIGHTDSAAEQLQVLAPTAYVVKAFNTIFAPLLDKPARNGKILQVFVAGNETIAVAKVSELARKLGFDSIEAGPLTNSRFLESIGEMNIQFGFFLNGGTGIAPAWVRV
jgi:NADPH-dependent F420 reductase